MIEEGEGAKAMLPGWWFDRAEGIGVEVVVSCVHLRIDEFAIFRVLTHLVPYLKIQRILVNELTSMTPKSKNTCRKLRVSAFKRY